MLNRLSRFHRKPAAIQVNNGTEFASRALDAWAYREDVRLVFSRPGKPPDKAHIESFNARLRAEYLNAYVLTCPRSLVQHYESRVGSIESTVSSLAAAERRGGAPSAAAASRAA